MYKILFIIICFIFTIISYFLFVKRVNYINSKHTKYTKVEWLNFNNIFLKKIILFLLIIMYLLIVFITLTLI